MPVLADIILTVSSIPPLHLSVQDYQNEMHHDVFSHLTLLALASASCFYNGSVNNTMQCNFFGHVMSLILVLVPHDANIVIYATYPFVDTTWQHDFLVIWSCHVM